MLAAPKVGAPVKWVEDRRENLLAAGQVAPRARRRDDGVRRRRRDPGRAHRLRLRLRRLPDAVAGRSPRPRSACCSPARTACRAASFATKTIYTNTVGRTAYRGPWQFETLAREVLLDIAARQMGIDPVELRRRNLLRQRRAAVHEPQRHDLRQHLAARDVRAGARRCSTTTRSAPSRPRPAPPAATSASASSNYVEPSTPGLRLLRAPRRRRSASSRRARSTCTSPAARPGTASRRRSCSSPPTRSASNIDDVNTIQGDTAVTGFGAGAAGSRSGSMTAGAVRETATILRERIVADRRAQARGRRSTTSSSPSSRASVRGTPSIGISFAEIAALAYFEPTRCRPACRPGSRRARATPPTRRRSG